jgi:hypothetical protein
MDYALRRGGTNICFLLKLILSFDPDFAVSNEKDAINYGPSLLFSVCCGILK